ncbi:hypothetical protein CLAFUW4_05993 [Fulvia fulva]|uniref:Peroxin 26 n=1 Tax=Passalora fulva TaxID=5499 RepID=A0A9Q8P935_PASFU|nr:uncharacterized protein CLAFUR5_06137 [Fulvia fulva]KAK4623883.1 hypothetical protein CLAFUR4_05998 [Fulvia fulva]KAK4624856.1 hypothetical protein CLAFUR0_06001 [Fulvia fulva]UJO17743.1 hypothetical protein CLAFUR5_06137 [Fulvia fulva]WPV14481.1 hypothetical protein CLAFUW4_05993 [Fulvia fulva]WPV29863.1 hypothetical protein CLAFUW7_05991 [Fulvia fulva]
MASTGTITYQDSLNSQYLSSSLSSLSRSRNTNSLIVRTYKQARQLYLTKRFKEAWETLEPIVSAQQPSQGPANGHGDASGPAPIAQSSKGTRTKVWVFYITLLSSIVDIGPEQGRNTFGSAIWRRLVTKVREGTIWDEIVRLGYGGSEGDVDPDVVVNLATLLESHMQSQKLNQQHLEAYLSASADAAQLAFYQDGTATPMSNHTSSPKELTTRLKIIELYALHVLPANEEWEYAQQFIEMNDMLDEERREAFLHALHSIKDEKDGTAQRERELEELREREMEEQRAAEEVKRKEEERKEQDRRKAAEAETVRSSGPASSNTRSFNGASFNGRPSSSDHKSPGQSASKASKSQKKTRIQPRSLYGRASFILHNLQHMIMQVGRNVTGDSMALMRFLMFMVALILVMARRDIRERLKRVLQNSWVKIRSTVGMGVKVSYV